MTTSGTPHEHPCGHECECHEPGAQWCDRCEIAEVMLRRHRMGDISRGLALAGLYRAMQRTLAEADITTSLVSGYKPLLGTPLGRLVDAATDFKLAYSDRVLVRQEDLRLVLGAYWCGEGPWELEDEAANQLGELGGEYRRYAAETFARANGQRL